MSENKTAEEIATEFVNQFSFVPRETIDLVEELAGSINQHHQSRLGAIIEEVEEQLIELGLPKDYATKELHDIMDASNPQEIGEIKAYDHVLEILNNHL